MTRNERVLITGAGGFIGSHVVEAAVEAGYAVRAMVRYNSAGDIRNLRFIDESVCMKIEIVYGDVADPFFVDSAVAGCQGVLHLAALIGIPYSYVAPNAYIQVNVAGTMNILEACKRHNIRRLVHTSTSEVYGTAVYTPIDAPHPLKGQSPYSASKIGADKLAESYFLSFGLPVTTLRPFNTYGPRQSARAVIPTIIGQLLRHPEFLEIGSLSPQRDFTFAADTARGFIKALQAEGVEGETINLGVGETYSIGYLVERIAALLGVRPEVRLGEERIRPDNSEVMLLLSNNEKARQRLGWSPLISLDEGLSATIDYFRRTPIEYGVEQYAR